MRQRPDSTERAQPRSRPLPVQSVPLPGAFCARCRGQGCAVRAGRRIAGRAQFAAQHRTRDRRFAHEHCPTDKKKRWPIAPRCRACARKKTRKKTGKCSNSTRCGPFWGTKSARSGFGWPSNGPAAASWPGRWAAGARPRPAASGSSCPGATDGAVGTSLTSGKPTLPSCPATSTGRAPRAKDKPTLSRPSTVPCVTAAACWCERVVRSANACKCTRPELKLSSITTIVTSSLIRPPPQS